MPINVSEALDSDTAEKITFQRFLAGAHVDGIYLAGSSTVIKALASVQQPTPQQIEQMPSGERNTDIRLFICNKKLQQADETTSVRADLISYQNKKYKVVQVLDWQVFGHTSAIAVRDKRSET